MSFSVTIAKSARRLQRRRGAFGLLLALAASFPSLSVTVTASPQKAEESSPSSPAPPITSDDEEPAHASFATDEAEVVQHNMTDASLDEARMFLDADTGDVLADRYRVICRLGEGRSSRVFLVHDPTALTTEEAVCALKVFRCEEDFVDGMRYENEVLQYLAQRGGSNGSGCVSSIVREHPLLHREFVAVEQDKATPVRDPDSTWSDGEENTLSSVSRGLMREYYCLPFEVLGPSVDKLMEAYGFHGIYQDVDVVIEIVKSTVEALALLRRLHIVHADLKPENLLFSRPSDEILSVAADHIAIYEDEQAVRRSSEGDNDDHSVKSPSYSKQWLERFLSVDRESVAMKYAVKITDFGLSYAVPEHLRDSGIDTEDDDDGGNKKPRGGDDHVLHHLIEMGCYQKGAIVQTREYRAPEILLGTDFNCAVDVWSLGCMAYELITGRMLFDPKVRPGAVDEVAMDALHLVEISAVIGAMPEHVVASCEASGVYYDRLFGSDDGYMLLQRLVHATSLGPEPETEPEDDGYVPPHIESEMEALLGPTEGALASNFILSCLKWDATQRATPKELLTHPWLLREES